MASDVVTRAVEAMRTTVGCDQCHATDPGVEIVIQERIAQAELHPASATLAELPVKLAVACALSCDACVRRCLLAAMRVVLAEPSEAAIDALDTMRHAKTLTASDDKVRGALRAAFAATLAELEAK